MQCLNTDGGSKETNTHQNAGLKLLRAAHPRKHAPNAYWISVHNTGNYLVFTYVFAIVSHFAIISPCRIKRSALIGAQRILLQLSYTEAFVQ